MSFDLVQDNKMLPENTTVGMYAVSRLSGFQTLRTTMVETRRDWLTLTVLSVVDPNADGVSEELRVAPLALDLVNGNSASLADRVVQTLDGVVIGTIGTVEEVAAQPATESVPATLAFWRLTLSGGGVTGAAPAAVQAPYINFFGAQVTNQAPAGRAWDLVLSSHNADQAARMQLMMVRIQSTFIALALAQLGVVKTADEIQAAAIAMLQGGNSADSIIASEMEQLEKDRRASVFTSMTLLGNAPQVG